MTTQDLINTLKQGKPMTDKLVREIVKELEDLKKLKKAVRLLAITAQPVLNEDGHLWITKHAVDKLAALVGEQK